MSEDKSMTKDTRAIIIAVAMAAVAIIGINKTDINGLRTEMRAAIRDMRMEIRELRGLLITHIAGHSHAGGEVVAKAGGAGAETQ
ncbi:MAG: hypothetical protein HAW59_06970 [Betaproteobacteria bacterium]|nr:hypothetical protein [Betaproteobacteria bacterium]